MAEVEMLAEAPAEVLTGMVGSVVGWGTGELSASLGLGCSTLCSFSCLSTGELACSHAWRHTNAAITAQLRSMSLVMCLTPLPSRGFREHFGTRFPNVTILGVTNFSDLVNNLR
jgi:hypothetical protein